MPPITEAARADAPSSPSAAAAAERADSVSLPRGRAPRVSGARPAPGGRAGVPRSTPGRPSIGVAGLIVLLVVGTALPLIAVLVRAVTGYNGQPSALGSLVEPGNLQIVGNTIVLCALVVLFSTLMAAPLAFFMSWTKLREQRWIDVLVMVPFMTPPYVAALAWLDFTRVGGLAEQAFGPLGSLARSFVLTPFGMAAVMACEIFPFLYLILRNHLNAVPASADEMASIAGASPAQRLRRIVAPLASTPFSLGVLIVCIRAAGEFGTPVTIGNQIGFPVLVSRVYADVTIDPLDFPSAAAFSSLLLSLGVVVWGLQQWIGRRDTHFGGRASRRTTVRVGGWIAAGWAWVVGIALVSVVIPYVAVVLGAMTLLRSQPLSLDNLTFDYFALVLQPNAGLPALMNSIGFAFAAATLAVLIGIACALVAARRKNVAGRLVDMLAVAPDTVPTIVLAIGFIFLWNAPWLPATPYNTGWMLIIAYAALFLPMVVQNIKTARLSIDDRLFEAAYAAGATGPQRFFRITLPLLLPGIIAGWMLAFLVGIREVVVSSLIRPASLDLLSPWIISSFDQGKRAEAMALTVIGVLGSTVILVALEVWRRRQAERRAT